MVVVCDDVVPGALYRLGSDVPTLSREKQATAWEGIVRALLRAQAGRDGIVRLSHIAKTLGVDQRRIHERCEHFDGLDKIPAAIARDIREPVQALVLSCTRCKPAHVSDDDATEVYSCHALIGGRQWLLSVARRHPDSEERWEVAWKVLHVALDLVERELLELAEGAMVLAPQQDFVLTRLRRLLVRHHLSYALAVHPSHGLRNYHQNYDELFDDRFADNTPGFYFEEAQLHGARPRTFAIKDLCHEPGRYELEHLVESVARDGEPSYSLCGMRPASGNGVGSEAERLSAARCALPQSPLGNRVRGHDFHHSSDTTWETMLMVTGLALGPVAL